MNTTSCIVCLLLTATIAICVEPDEVVPEIVPERLLATITSQDKKKYSLAGKGVARAYPKNSPDYVEGTELWLWQSSSKGRGVQECFEAVLADTRCSEFFTYVTYGDQNCGCRPKSSAMATQVVKNKGVNCWLACGSKQGPCAWCGTGVCCRSGWPDTSNGCDGTLGIVGSGQHVCVASGDFSTRTDGLSHYFKISTECPTGKSVRGTGSLCLAPPPVLLSMAGGGHAAQMVATGVIAGLSRTGTGIMDRISAVSGNSGGTWSMDGLILSQSFYDRVTTASNDDKVKLVVRSLFQDLKDRFDDQFKLDKDLQAASSFVLTGAVNGLNTFLKGFGNECVTDLSRILFPATMGLYMLNFNSFAKKVIDAYYPEMKSSNPTFNSASSTLALTPFGKRVRATYTTTMAATTWAYAKDPLADWWGKGSLYINKIIQRPVARWDAPWGFKDQITSFEKNKIGMPLAFSKPPQGNEKAEWVYSRSVDRLELLLERGVFNNERTTPITLNLPEDPTVHQVTAMSSAAGGILSTDFLATFGGKEIVGQLRGTGVSVSGVEDSNLWKNDYQPEWSQQSRFIDGAYSDNTGLAFGIAQMQADLGGIKEDLRVIQVDYNGQSLPALFANAGDTAGGEFPLPVLPCKIVRGSKPQVFEETYPTDGWSARYQGMRIWKGTVTTVMNPWYNIQAGWKVKVFLVDANRDDLPMVLHPSTGESRAWAPFEEAAVDVANAVAYGGLVESFLA